MFVCIESKNKWLNLHYVVTIEELEHDGEKQATSVRVTEANGKTYTIINREDISALLSAAAGFGKPARPSL
jgi:hypothetical protein